MAINFMKNIHDNSVDDKTHQKFIRYGIGQFEKEEMKITVGSSIKVYAGFEYLDTMFWMLSEVVKDDVELNGTIVSKKDILSEIKDFGIEPKNVTGKKYTIKETFSADRFREFVKTFSGYVLLVKVKSKPYALTMKASVPKPGKLVEKFLSATFSKDDYDLIRKELLFDHEADFKQASIRHLYEITNIDIPEEYEDDPAKARLHAVRKGKVIRKMVIDGEERINEFPLAA